MNELNDNLRNQAIKHGICDDFLKQWDKDWTNEKMVEMMYKGMDFCLKHHYPANDFITNNFSRDFLRNSNVFVNDKYSSVNPKQSIILGTSEVTFRYNMWNHGTIYIRDNASLRLSAKNRAFVIVHIFDEAHINAEHSDKAKIVIIKHSDKVTVVADTDIKVTEEYDYLK